MRIFAPATAAFAMLAAPSALAQTSGPESSGHVGGQYSHVTAELGPFAEADENAWAGEGAFAFDFGSLGLQADGSVARVEGDAAEATLVNLNGHFFFDGENWRLGLATGTASIKGDDSDEELDEWYFGAEGQVWVDRAAFSGSAVIGSADAFFSDELDAWNLDANADFYITDNLVIGAGVGRGSLEGEVDDIDTASFGVGGEFQFTGAPVSLHAGYDHFEIDDAEISTDALTIGARWNWGGTLKQRDRAGFRHSPSGGLINRIYGS